MDEKLAVIVLAAGKGTRMKSELAKVLHPLAGFPMIVHLVKTIKELGSYFCLLVVGHQSLEVKKVLKDFKLAFAEQKEQLGTAHAVLSALPFIPEKSSSVMVLCGDAPLISKESLLALYEAREKSSAALSFLAAELDDPYGYGRLVLGEDSRVLAIVEEKDASEEEKKIKFINGGFYCFDKDFLVSNIEKIGSLNKQSEYYLTDLVARAVELGLVVEYIKIQNSEELMGINTKEQLSLAEKILTNKSKAF